MSDAAVSPPAPTPAHEALIELYRAAIGAVAPGPALTRALQEGPSRALQGRVWVIALGKAAAPMAQAAVDALVLRGHAPAGGLVVGPAEGLRPHPSVVVLAGDHPEPGARSRAAADALDRLTGSIPAGDTVWVLLSGGTTSLVGAPLAGLTETDLTALYSQLLRSGLDIGMMNRVRKRFTRWGAGRLARSLQQARVDCYVVSDVIGDELADIGSGPCVPDPTTARDVGDALLRAGLWQAVPAALRRYVEATDQGSIPETPKPGDRAFDRVTITLIATNRLALDAAARRAEELQLIPHIEPSPLVGEAATVGAAIAQQLLADAEAGHLSHPTHCRIFGGETTVTMREPPAGPGGRCQELALAAARVLGGAPSNVALLAAGTDGRDGPTDAAGALVDGATWDCIVAAKQDPELALRRHDSYAALDRASALVKTGLTGTNVMDVVIGVY